MDPLIHSFAGASARHWGEQLELPARVTEASRFCHGQMQRMPASMRIFLSMALWILNRHYWLWGRASFKAQSESLQVKHLSQLREHRLGPVRDVIRFIDSMVLLVVAERST